MNNTRKVLVLGSIGGDVVARTPRMPRLGETVMGSEVHFFNGGKGANQAVAAARAGATVAMFGRVGRDAAGDAQKKALREEGIDITGITTSEHSTQTAIILLDETGQNSIVVVPAASGLVDESEVLLMDIQEEDWVVCQGEVPLDAVAKAFVRAKRAGAKTVLNLAPMPDTKPDETLLQNTDFLILNETETVQLYNLLLDKETTAEVSFLMANEIRVREDQVVIVTLGEAGAFAVQGKELLTQSAVSVEVVDSTGAGDCFVGNLVARLAARDSLSEAMRRAGLAASDCVQRMGTAVSFPRATN